MSVHIGNLHHDAHKGDLDREFGRYGRIKSMWIARSPPGFAFVEFEDTRDAEDAIRAMDGRDILGRKVRVHMKKSGRFGDHGHRNNDGNDNSRKPTRSAHRIIITGLPSDFSWKDIRSLLQEKTDPVYVDMRGEGKAVAEFSSEGDVTLAIESFNGIGVNGSNINIEKDDKGGDERSDSWQKFDTRPRRGRGGDGNNFRGVGKGSRNHDRRYRDRQRSRSRSRSRSRDRRYNEDRRRRCCDRGGDYDRGYERERSRDGRRW